MSNEAKDTKASPFAVMQARREAAANNPAVKINAAEGWFRGASASNASPGKRRIFNREAQRTLTGGYTFYYRADLGQYPDFTPDGYTVFMSPIDSTSGHGIGKAKTPEEAVEMGRAAIKALHFASWLEVDREG